MPIKDIWPTIEPVNFGRVKHATSHHNLSLYFRSISHDTREIIMKYYMLYCRFPNQKRYRPINWAEGKQVLRGIHASIFTEHEKHELEHNDLKHPDNKHIKFEFRQLPE